MAGADVDVLGGMGYPAYMHDGSRPLRCRYCGEAFDSMPRLAAHISHHHSKKRRKAREERMIELLEELLKEVKGLREDLRRLQMRTIEVKEERTIKQTEIKAEKEKPEKPLPSFLSDNPWVDILSRRK